MSKLDAILSQEQRTRWKKELERHLLQDVLGFWRKHTLDVENGGYITAVDRFGNVLSLEKNIWLHARQVWMFSTIYSNVDRDPEWLALAKAGRDFIVSHAYQGKGRWNYLLDSKGSVVTGTVALFTDLFVIMGLSAYSIAAKSNEDLSLINDTFDALYINIKDDNCKDVFPAVYTPGLVHHGRYMIAVNALSYAGQVINDPRCDELIAWCIKRIFDTFVDSEKACVYEIKSLAPSADYSEDMYQINPGHIFESMWFVLSQTERLGLQQYDELAIHIIRETAAKSTDAQYGGVLHMLDARGIESKYKDWNKARNLQWDEKVWWTQAEALCAYLMAADKTGDAELFRSFEELYNWCCKYFFDKPYGEWFAVLHRDGTPRILDKGGLQKAAFHIPRALYICLMLMGGCGLQGSHEKK